MSQRLKVLLIGYPDSKVRSYLSNEEELSFIDGSELINIETIEKYGPEYIVLHGCHSILDEKIVENFPRRIINLHGAYLPWNRGGHPNLWSFLENTPKGGSVHFIDGQVDKGELISRKEIKVFPDDTLASTYKRVKSMMEDLFISLWPSIKDGTVQTIRVDNTEGSYHAKKELKAVQNLLTDGWNTKISSIISAPENLGREFRDSLETSGLNDKK